MKDVYLIILVAIATLFTLTTADDNLEVGIRDGKLISTFQIVRFPNDACSGSSSTRNGTCYTSAECSDKGGTSQGSCADGFGVCCIFVIDACGQTSSENITYWDAPATVPTGECNLYITPVSDNICQLRLDFLTFIITGPSTTSLSETNVFASGIPGGAVGLAVADTNEANWSTNCLTDSFSVSSPNPANKPPTICGIISGEHMYVDMEGGMTNVLSFIFQEKAGPATTSVNTRGVAALASRDWDITILQYECGYINSAPPGCTQYLWSDTGLQVGGWIQSYNFQATGSKHLANQNQKICIRRERTICWASFYKAATGTFNIAGKIDISVGTALGLDANIFTANGIPCGYACELGTGFGDEDNVCNYDCVIIPGSFVVAVAPDGDTSAVAAPTDANVRAFLTAATNHSPSPPQISASSLFGGPTLADGAALADGTLTVAMTVFTQHVPFQFTFKSDGFEGLGGDMEGGLSISSIGFKMSYNLIPCTA